MNADIISRFDDEDRRALFDLMLDLQVKHGFSTDDAQGVLHTACFIAHGLGASITTIFGGHTNHNLTADWFSPEKAERIQQAIKLLKQASIELATAADRRQT